MFDIPNEKWFVRIENDIQSTALQKWLFEKGLTWAGDKVVHLTDPNGKVIKAIGFGHFGGHSIGQAGVDWWIKNGHTEIKVSLKTVVQVDTFEVCETETSKRINELKDLIAKASKEINKLQKIHSPWSE